MKKLADRHDSFFIGHLPATRLILYRFAAHAPLEPTAIEPLPEQGRHTGLNTQVLIFAYILNRFVRVHSKLKFPAKVASIK
jgi:hypothetical protein